MQLRQIISGAQTGADRAALEWAKENGIETGGWMPKDFHAEDGNHPEFAALYGLRCTVRSGYNKRTELNVHDSDATMIFGDINSSGSKLTARLCAERGKPVMLVEFPAGRFSRVEGAQTFLSCFKPRVLNIAGNRESRNSGIGDFVKTFLSAVIRR